MRKNGKKVGFLVSLALLVPAVFVVMEYFRNWRHSLNALVGSHKKGW